MIRSYKFKTNNLNKTKHQALLRILFEYRRIAKIILNKQLTNLFKTGQLSTESKNFYGDIKTFLSERYKDVIKRQVDGMIKSYVSNRKNNFKEIIYKSKLSEELKKELYIINKRNAWFEANNFLARKIFKHILKRNSFPSVKHINMLINTKVYDLEQSINTSFPFWVKLRSCDDAKNIMIPLEANTYFDRFEGQICNSIQINFDKKNNLSGVVLCKELKDQKETYVSDIDTVGIDIGLSTLIATDKGDLYSPIFMNKLTYYDNKIQKLQKELRKRGHKKLNDVSSRYRKYNRKLKAFIKNEVNRVLNRIVKLYNPKTIALEDLMFKNPNLSKRLNRMLSNFGLSVIKGKLAELNEKYGIEIKYINPAYTSQMCSGCSYVDEKNRKKRDEFECRCCGLKLHADVNGSRNIKGRSVDSRFTLKMKRENILKLIIDDFVNDQAKYSSKSWTAFTEGNKYFQSMI